MGHLIKIVENLDNKMWLSTGDLYSHLYNIYSSDDNNYREIYGDNRSGVITTEDERQYWTFNHTPHWDGTDDNIVPCEIMSGDFHAQFEIVIPIEMKGDIKSQINYVAHTILQVNDKIADREISSVSTVTNYKEY